MEIINKCFSNNTVEEILLAQEKEIIEHDGVRWMSEAMKSMKAASPTSLKICLRSIKEGRKQTLEQCFAREYIILSNIMQRSISNDFYEGTRAKLIDKDNKPKWEPPNLQSVGKEMVNRYFTEVDDPHWEVLRLPHRGLPNLPVALKSKI
ncbi:hypothetical protein PTKIN_Ptkin10aG0087300 [Pterospermum kingtungense]